ncbi:MAG TPA: FtsX-like permease family protein [Streptosporangiaceae bacterium]
MYRLGLRLTLRSGREPFARLLVTAVAVAIAVGILLAVLADFHAFRVTSYRPSWESTTGQAVTAGYASASHSELWNYSNDIYRGQTIERLDVASLGPDSPVPPGVSKLPAAGQYYASPALAALIRSAPANQLGDRFPGRLTGTIGQAALTGPDELVVYIGYAPARLAGLPATMMVDRISTTAGRQVWTDYFRDAFLVGAIAFVFPILILVGTATRLAAARREERYAALRLVGATSRQIGVISSVDAVVSALLGTLAGIGIFTALRPVLAHAAITSERYFYSQVTPTALGYLAVLVAVPAASAIAALVSLRRVRISPLGVSRRVTPPPPSAWRLAPLLTGIVLFILGIVLTTKQKIGVPVFPGLIIILIGLVVGGPWLTAQAARLFGRLMAGTSSLLASRRLADNPKAAFRSVTGLVLAVFLGTLVAGLLPAVESITATPRATALSNVLLDGFMAAPVCGNSVNCTGNSPGGGPGALPGGGQPSVSLQRQRIALDGLPPVIGASLLSRLATFRGAAVIPIYSLPPGGNLGVPGPGGPGKGPISMPQYNAVISCAGLRELRVLGQCAPGRQAVKVNTLNLIQSDNPYYSSQPITSASNPAATGDVSKLYLQAVLIKVNGPAALERVRTFLVTHTPQSASGAAPRTFGEAVQARQGVAATVQRLIDVAVVLTLVVAGCSLAVAVGGSLVERKRPFMLLRLTGTPTSALYRVVFLEAVLPLLAATIVAGGMAYGLAVLTVQKMAPAGTPVPVPGAAYYLTMGAGLVASLLVILASLPLLGRITGPGSMRFE